MNSVTIAFPEGVNLQRIDSFVSLLQSEFGQRYGTMHGASTSYNQAGFAQTIFEGVTYKIEVTKDDEGVTNVKFISDPPPQGLDRIRYEWTGRLREGKKTTNREDQS